MALVLWLVRYFDQNEPFSRQNWQTASVRPSSFIDMDLQHTKNEKKHMFFGHIMHRDLPFIESLQSFMGWESHILHTQKCNSLSFLIDHEKWMSFDYFQPIIV